MSQSAQSTSGKGLLVLSSSAEQDFILGLCVLPDHTPSKEGHGMNASTYTFNSAAEIQLTRLLGIPKLTTPKIKFTGPTKILRANSTAPSPGRFFAETTLQEMNLTGKVLGVDVKASLNPDYTSKGGIEGRADPKSKDPNSPDPAGKLRSYFDVFISISTPLGTLINKEPVRMEAQIKQVPPAWARYKQYSPPRTLFDKVIGSIIADALHATHVVELIDGGPGKNSKGRRG